MPTKLKIVAVLKRDELWGIIDKYALPVEDRRKLDYLQAAVRQLPKSGLREILLDFERERLKEICRDLGLDDSGKLIAEIADRIIGNRDTEPDIDEVSEPNQVPRKVRFLDALNRSELWNIIDEYGLSVEDRRVREQVIQAASSLSSLQIGTVLERFTRDRLKEICRTLELDDTGKLKSELVGRITGESLSDSTQRSDVNTQNSGGNAREPDVNAQKPDVNTEGPDRSSKEPNVYTQRHSDNAKESDDNNTQRTGDNAKGATDKRTKTGRPRLFIGSTVEALHVAREVQSELHYDFQVTVWNQSLFSPGDWTWSRLVEMARHEFDFALLVFSADDVVESRGALSPAIRDNVLLEYGLFVGALGPERTFFLYNHDHRPKIATDLAGVTALTYGDRDDDNLQAAVGPACHQLHKRNAKLGRREQ